MDPETHTPSGQEENTRPAKRKGRLIIPILLILALLAAVGGGAAYYINQKQLSEQAVDNFMQSMKEMDFDSMKEYLQSSDLSSLENADIQDASYEDFFRDINSKLSWKITGNQFDIQNGTAQVSVYVKYFDGTNIYRETISEFLRQIVSTAFSGEQLSEEETQTRLASILAEKAAQAEETYSETEITYPLIKTGNDWKIVSLDSDTVKIMSANFKSVEEEINDTLTAMEQGESLESALEEETENTSSIDMTTDKFSVRYVSHKTAKDISGKDCILVYYEYTNLSPAPSSAMVDIHIQAYQHGEICEAAIPAENDPALDQFMAETATNETVTVCQAYSLTDTSDIILKASESFNFTGGTSASQILKIDKES